MKKTIVLTCLLIMMILGRIQSQTGDTVIVELARASKMVLTVHNRDDLYHLRNYDFQALFDDILTKLENKDTISDPSKETMTGDEFTTPFVEDVTVSDSEEEDYSENDNDDYDEDDYDEDDYDEDDYDEDSDDHWDDDDHNRLSHSFNFDFGMNNYLENGSFPDADGAQYTVRPWGSWYVGIGSVLSMPLSKKFYVEMGLGVNWYNFKFEEDNTLVVDGDDGVEFLEDTRGESYKKSKLSMTYLNASLVPMFHTGGYHHHSHFWHRHSDGFRIGLGPYVGYRLESHSKIVYETDNDTEKDKDKDNFYLNNLRYGLRLQMGIEGLDIFVNYDLNPLFIDGKGPELHAFSFGLIF